MAMNRCFSDHVAYVMLKKIFYAFERVIYTVELFKKIKKIIILNLQKMFTIEDSQNQ